MIIGGALLGLGWALTGVCPGTSVVGLGSGRLDALFFIIGGLLGAAAYMLSYESLANTWLFDTFWGGKRTLAETDAYEFVLGYDGWMVALSIAAALVVTAWVLPKRFRSV